MKRIGELNLQFICTKRVEKAFSLPGLALITDTIERFLLKNPGNNLLQPLFKNTWAVNDVR